MSKSGSTPVSRSLFLKSFRLSLVTCWITASLMGALSGDVLADSVPHTVEAKGKDVATAEKNARTAATREIMNELTDAAFIKAHTQDIRKNIINRSHLFTMEVELLGQNPKGNLVEIQAVVQVNREAIAGELKKMGAVLREMPQNDSGASGTGFSGAALGAVTGYEESIRRIFGEGMTAENRSAVLPAVDTATPVTGVMFPEVEFNGVTREEYAPGDRITAGFRIPPSLGIDNREVTVVMTYAGIPVDDFNAGNDRRLNDVIWNFKEDRRFFNFITPARQGSYELRLYANKNKKRIFLARQGFRVTAGRIPSFKVARNVFAPGESFFVSFDDITGMPTGKLYIAAAGSSDKPRRQIKVLHESPVLADFTDPGTGTVMKAPATEGEYELILVDDCRGVCTAEESSSAMTPAVSSLKFTVKKPKVLRETVLAVPPEITAGGRPGYAFLWDDAWRTVAARVSVTEKATGREVAGDYPDTAKGASRFNLLPALYRPGEYELAVFPKNDPEKRITAPFKVVPALSDSSHRTYIATDTGTTERGSALMVTGRAPSTADGTAFIALVPGNIDKSDIKKVLEATEGNRITTGHSRRISLDFPVKVEPGDYELTLYDAADERGSALVQVPVHVESDDEKAERRRLAGERTGAFINSENPDSDESRMLLLKNKFLMPEAPKLTSLGSMQFTWKNEEYPEYDPAATAEYRLSKASLYLNNDTLSDMAFFANVLGRTWLSAGYSGNLRAAVNDFTAHLLANAPFMDTGKHKELAEYLRYHEENYDYTAAVLNTAGRDNYTGSSERALAGVLEKFLDITGNQAYFERMLAMHEDELKRYLASLDAGLFEEEYHILSRAVRSPESSRILKEIADYRGNYSASGKATGNSREIMRRLASYMRGYNPDNPPVFADALLVILSADPQFAVPVGRLQHIGDMNAGLADFMADREVNRLYWMFRRLSDSEVKEKGGIMAVLKEAPELLDATQKKAALLMQVYPDSTAVQNAMTPDNLKKALAYQTALQRFGAGDERTQKIYAAAGDYKEAEILKFIEQEFYLWAEAERRCGLCDEVKNFTKSFMNLNTPDYPHCESDFYDWSGVLESIPELAGKSNIDTAFTPGMLWQRGSKGELAAYISYIKTGTAVKTELKRWNTPQRKMNSGDVSLNSASLVCLLAKPVDGARLYGDKIAGFGCEYGWNEVNENTYTRGMHEVMFTGEADLTGAVRYIGREDMLPCLCEKSGEFSRNLRNYSRGFRPIVFKEDGSYPEKGGGVCYYDKNGSVRYPLSMVDTEVLRTCGYMEAVTELKRKSLVSKRLKKRHCRR